MATKQTIRETLQKMEVGSTGLKWDFLVWRRSETNFVVNTRSIKLSDPGCSVDTAVELIFAAMK